jgi:hypothetical protein
MNFSSQRIKNGSYHKVFVFFNLLDDDRFVLVINPNECKKLRGTFYQDYVRIPLHGTKETEYDFSETTKHKGDRLLITVLQLQIRCGGEKV